MDFAFPPVHEELARQVRQVPATAGTHGCDGIDRALWAILGELGFLGVAIDDACGGGGVLDPCALAREFGRADVAVPFASSICTFAELLARHGSPASKERWLPRVAHGSCIRCVAIAEGASTGSARTGGEPRTGGEVAIATRMHDGGLFGAKQSVADGCVAHVAIVAARGGDAAVGAYLVELDQTGIARVAIRELDAAGRTARLDFDGAACEPLPGADWPALAAALDRAAVCAAFAQLGRAERVVERAIDQNR